MQPAWAEWTFEQIYIFFILLGKLMLDYEDYFVFVGTCTEGLEVKLTCLFLHTLFI